MAKNVVEEKKRKEKSTKKENKANKRKGKEL